MTAKRTKTERPPSIARMAELAGTSQTTIKTWRKRSDWPNPKTEADFMPYARERLHDAAEKQRGENSELKALKLRKQCDLLTEQIRRAAAEARRVETQVGREEKNLLPRREVELTLTNLFQAMRGRLEMWVSTSTAKYPQLRADIIRLRDSHYQAMRESLEEVFGTDTENEKENADNDD